MISTKEIEKKYDDQIEEWKKALAKERDLFVSDIKDITKRLEEKHTIVWSQTVVVKPEIFVDVVLEGVTNEQVPEVLKNLAKSLAPYRIKEYESPVGYITSPAFRIRIAPYSEYLFGTQF